MKTIPLNRRRPSLVAGVIGAAAALMLAFTPAASADEAANPTLKVDWDAEGTTHIGGGVDASSHIGPTVLHSEFDPMTLEIVDGTMDIPSSVMNFDVLGIPARATVSLSQASPMTGQITTTGLGEGSLTSDVSYDIQISDLEAKVFGIWWPLGVGSNCHTIDPVDITASTPEGEVFTIGDGGPLEGTFSIGNFTGCTPLNFFDIPGFFPWFGSIPINAIVPNSDNTIELNISNPRYAG